MSNTKDVYTPATAGADLQRNEPNGGLDDPRADHVEEGVAGPSKKPKKSLKDAETWKAGAKRTWRFIKPVVNSIDDLPPPLGHSVLGAVGTVYKIINNIDDDDQESG
ncbi:hypothetical protein FRB90_010443 [Tulasnella sp. 427]|nr:hypothetical protein FRB90_010443 [Tulasnella sp. 427]